MQATRNIAEVARTFKRLRGFVHLSTAYVNCNRPKGSHVEERLYSFDAKTGPEHPSSSSGGSAAELAAVEVLADELAALPEAAASQRVRPSSSSHMLQRLM